MSAPEFIPPNEDMLAIARLYLEKYELLSEHDRQIYRNMVGFFMTPTITWLKGDTERVAR